MKELLVIFLLALAIGAYMNGVSQSGPTPQPSDRPPEQTAVTTPEGSTSDSGGHAFDGTTGGSATAASGTVTELGESDFQEKVLKSQTPVFVDFYATWCGPCHRMDPIVNQLAEQYKGRAIFYKIDIDRNQTLSTQYRIDSLPTYVVFSGGTESGRTSGAQDASGLKALLDKH